MKRYILAFLLSLLMVSLTVGWDLSLAPGLSAKNALLYLIIIIGMVEMAVFRNLSFDLPSVVIPFALVAIYALVSWFAVAFVVQMPTYNPVDAGIALKTELIDHFLIFLIFFFGISTAAGSLSLIRFLLWMAIVGNLVAVVDAFDIPDLGIIEQREDGRVSGPIGESNAYGAFIAMTLPGIAVLAIESAGMKRVIAILGVFVTVLALFLTASRGAMVGLAAGGIFSTFFLRDYVSFRRVRHAIIILSVAVAATLIVFFATGYLGLLEERFIEQSSGGAYEASSSRSAIWTLALRRMIEYPYSVLIGFGWDAYNHMGGLFPRATHNFYLNKWFNLGLPGLVLYLLLFYNILRNCRKALERASRSARLHLMSFVFGLTSLGGAIFFIDLHAPWIFIWAYVGLIMRLAVESLRGSDAPAPHGVTLRMERRQSTTA
jgi:O-antigen ligase